LKTSLSIRKAVKGDVDSIYEIIMSYSEEGILLSRSLEDIHTTIGNFSVAILNDTVVGIISFFDYGDHLKEVRSLAVRKDHLRKGIGSTLLQKLIQELTAGNTPVIFVLTYAPGFFKKNRFIEINMDGLPEKIWKDCIYCKKQDNCTEIAMEYAAP
jgi:amino-acid N-acetyltransferase